MIKAIYNDVEEGKIFGETHKALAYYAAAYVAYRLEYLFRNSYIDSDWKSFRYSLINAFKNRIVGLGIADPSSRDIERQSQSILEVAYENEAALEAFNEIIDSAKAFIDQNTEYSISRDTACLVSFRDDLAAAIVP